MAPGLLRLFEQQQASGFADLRGTRADLTVPIGDRLLNQIITEALPPSAPVRDLKVRSRADDRITVRFKLGAASFLPPIKLTLVIERQPALPASPVLVLRLETGGLLSVAGPALRFLDALPPGIRVDGDRIHVDLAVLLAERGLAPLLEHAEQIQVTTIEGALVVAIRAVIRGE